MITSTGWLLIGVAVLVWPMGAAVRGAAGRNADRDLAVALDLAAAALRCGQPVGTALELAAPAAGGARRDRLLLVAGLLRLGADPDEAWRVVAADGALAPVARAAERSATSGIRLARGLETAADDLRAQLRAVAQARAHRVGVLMAGPLGLCFLPAFVCLGVAPVVIGLAGTGLVA